MIDDQVWQDEPVAVMVSGGPDSMILAAELCELCPRVVPIYVRFGMIWEAEEEKALRQFLNSTSTPTLEPLQIFDLPLSPVYGSHWSTTGEGVPDAQTADDAVFLPGRNLLILAQPAIWCHLNHVSIMVLGLLKGNPFPDSTPEFFASYQKTIKEAVGSEIRIVCPYQHLNKVEVLQRGRAFPLEHTWSCMRPREGLHCGDCNKCAERQRAFHRANIPDPTRYATSPVRIS